MPACWRGRLGSRGARCRRLRSPACCWSWPRYSSGSRGAVFSCSPGRGYGGGSVPRVSMWLVRAALVYLLLGFTLGAVMLAGKALGHSAWIAGWIPIHVELVLVGWMLQLAMGVALWIDRKSTRLNSSHPSISYAVFCLKKKKIKLKMGRTRRRVTVGGPYWPHGLGLIGEGRRLVFPGVSRISLRRGRDA